MVRITQAGHGQTVEQFGVRHCVPAGYHAAGFPDLFGTARQDGGQDVKAHRLGHAGNVQGEQDFAAHGKDVAHGIGGRDGPEGFGIVDDGREKVRGLDQGLILMQGPHGGIVGLLDAGPQGSVAGTLYFIQLSQNLRQLPGREFRCSAGAGGQRCQLDVRVHRYVRLAVGYCGQSMR